MNSKESITRSVIFSISVRSISRIVGLIRTLLIAAYFGATVGTDGFQVASGIMFFFFLFIESALEMGVVSDLAAKKDPNSLHQAVWAYIFKLGFFCAALTGLLLLGKNQVLDFLIPAQNVLLREATVKFLPAMTVGSIAYIFYRFLCLAERSQQRFSAEIISDLFLSVTMTIYLVFRHQDVAVLGESYLVANLAALIFIGWRAQALKWSWDLFNFRLLRSPDSFLLLVGTGIIGSISLVLEKKLGANAPGGTLTIYAYATVIFRFMISYGSAVVQVFHPSFHEADGHRRFMQVMKMMWLYAVPIAFVTVLSADFITLFLFSSKKLSTLQLAEMSLMIKLLGLYLFTELAGNPQIRYLVSHGGLKVFNILFSIFATVSFLLNWYFSTILGFQVLVSYNLVINAALLLSTSWVLIKVNRLVSLKDHIYLVKLLTLGLVCFLLAKGVARVISLDAMLSSVVVTAVFVILFLGGYYKFIEDEINRTLWGKLSGWKFWRKFK